MIKSLLIAAVVAVAISSPAVAFYCPKNVKAIDAALSKARLNADQKAKVQGLRDRGNAQHKAGNHRAAVKSLAEAVRIILATM